MAGLKGIGCDAPEPTDALVEALTWLEEASEDVGESRSREDPPEMLTGYIATQSRAREQVLALLWTKKTTSLTDRLSQAKGSINEAIIALAKANV